jgi:biopolymer transport protein ExbB
MHRNHFLFTRSKNFPGSFGLILLTAILVPLSHVQGAATQATESDLVSSLPILAGKGAPPDSLAKLLFAGGWVMIPLLLLSIITLALCLIYLVSLRRGAVAGSRFMSTSETLLNKGDLMGVLAIANRHRDIVSGIIARTLEFLSRNPKATDEQLREIAQTEGGREAATLNQRVSWLADIATIAPMLGLLGTVFGMISSFSVMANDVAASRPMLLAAGVAQALVATAAGLVIGIPAMAAYAFFRGRVQQMISEMEGATALLLTKIVIARGKNSHF